MEWTPGSLPETAEPNTLGLDGSRLANIKPYLQGYIDQGKLAGASFAIMRDERLAYYLAVGEARIGESTMNSATIHRIYSMSKAITSVALLTLYEQAKFQLDDPLEKYLPEFADPQVFTAGSAALPTKRHANQSITPRHLMTHTSGLTYGFEGVPHAVDQMHRYHKIGGFDDSLEMFSQKLARQPLRFDPGSSWNYSFATDLQGRLIEVLSGKPFEEYLKENIFDPLGMIDTGFHVKPDQIERFANNYARPKGPLEIFDDAISSEYLSERVFKSGGGGLVSTLPDYMRFAQMLLNKGELEGTRVLSRKTVEYATLNHLPGDRDMEQMGAGGFSESAFTGIGHCLIGSVCVNPAAAPNMQSYGDFGWGGAAGTRFWVDPEEGIQCVFMTQFMPGGRYPIQEYLRHLVCSAIID